MSAVFGRALVCAAVLLFAPATGWAQVPTESFTDGSTHTDAFNDIFQTARQDTYLTRIVGRVDGGAVVYDMTFAQAFGNPLIDAAVAAAQAALNAALSPAPTILGPTQVASTVTLESSVTELVSTILTDITTLSVQTIITFGPGLIFTGEDLLTPYQVGIDETNYNTISDLLYSYDRTYLTTETYLTSQTYELVGYAQQVVSGVPEPAGLALLGLGLAGLAARRRRKTSPTSIIRRALVCAAVLLAAPATGWAQGPADSFTSGTTHTSIFNDIFQTARQDTYLTRIVGRIDGGGVVYDMTFAQPYGNPLIDAAVAAAQAALNAALSPAPTILGPTQVASTVTLESSVMELVSTILTDTTSSVRTVVTFGPALIFTGEDLLTPYQVGDDETNFNTITDFKLFYDRTYLTTETYLTSQTYELVGYAQQVVSGVPEPAGLALLGLGLAGLAARRRRLRA